MTNRKNYLTKEEVRICDQAFEKLPNKFSSRLFRKHLILCNADRKFVDSNMCTFYLLAHAKIIKGTKTYIKNNTLDFVNDIIEKNTPEKNIDQQIKDAIDLLVSTGKYKIYIRHEELKPIN